MSEQAYTVAEFAELQKVNRATVYRWIKAGKVKTEERKGMLHVVIDSIEESDPATEALAETVSLLKQQLQEKDEQIREKDEQIRSLQESALQQNAIVMQLTRNNERIQQLIEHQQTPFWRRWFRKRTETLEE